METHKLILYSAATGTSSARKKESIVIRPVEAVDWEGGCRMGMMGGSRHRRRVRRRLIRFRQR